MLVTMEFERFCYPKMFFVVVFIIIIDIVIVIATVSDVGETDESFDSSLCVFYQFLF